MRSKVMRMRSSSNKLYIAHAHYSIAETAHAHFFTAHAQFKQ